MSDQREFNVLNAMWMHAEEENKKLEAENERLRVDLEARNIADLVNKCFVCEEADAPREGCDCVCCTVKRAQIAVAAERERCAKLAEDCASAWESCKGETAANWGASARIIAAAIRRGET